ncbi:phage tail sheath subtilisin-like domain-containing protein [Psychrobacillus sp.]|uniref:phage tail sheath subtilisin-like domain-containing protein n=1 Tax=Psychrobacillus sp. TaxID=1871623 RepID=UPI0028BDE4D7|nr:phage tail sheath subtilisin-like domain-containing protein [Psychrobacillus sp.]
MAGGTWETQNKVRPGAYVNFETNSLNATGLDSKGSVVIPIALDWGESGKFIKVTSNNDFKQLFGKTLSELTPLREAFKGTGQVIVYNLNGTGEKATATSEPFIATANYGGSDGNKISVTVAIGLSGSSTVKTFFDGSQVDSQIVTTIDELKSNAFVSFSGDLPSVDVTLTLVGGTTVTATNESYSNFAEGLDTQDFKVLAVGTEDSSVKLLLTLKVKEWREQQGKNVTLVTNDYNTADFEGVVSVINGVTLTGNEQLTAKESLYWYAAAYANSITNSLTYTEYPGAIDCERKMHDEIVQALKDGHIIYTFNNESVVVEQDINTFRSFTTKKNQDFRKNKLVRIMDIIQNNVQHVFTSYFIGKVDNNVDGRNIFKQQIITNVLDPLEQRGALSYDVSELDVKQGQEKDSVVAILPVTLADSMEKLYMTVKCK